MMVLGLGAIIGDFLGSPYEFKGENLYSNIDILKATDGNMFTDDTVMTLAVNEILNEFLNKDDVSEEKIVEIMQTWGRKYINVGYGHMFGSWIMSKNPKPYGSWGNGALMRISPIALSEDLSYEDKIYLGLKITNVTHNSKEANECVIDYINTIEYILRKREEISDDIKCPQLVTSLNVRKIMNDDPKRYNDPISSIDIMEDVLDNHLDNTLSCWDTLIAAKWAFSTIVQPTTQQKISKPFLWNNIGKAYARAIKIYPDTDTCAAIVGGMLEAYVGKPTLMEFIEAYEIDGAMLDSPNSDEICKIIGVKPKEDE